MGEERKYALAAIFGQYLPDMVSNHTPHAARLRIKVEETGPGFAVLTVPSHDELVGDPSRGVVFGGVITTLIDQTAGLAVVCALEHIIPIATIDLRIDYLRAAHPSHDLHARAECYKLTRNIAFVRASAYDDSPSDPFASCLATFMLGSHPPGGPAAHGASGTGSGGVA